MLVPHPYAWLNLKVRAAHDWLKERRGEIASTASSETAVSKRLKHVFDVYLLVATLTEQELTEAELLAKKFNNRPEAQAIITEATELFGKPTAQGFEAISNYSARIDSGSVDFDLFWTTMTQALGAS